MAKDSLKYCSLLVLAMVFWGGSWVAAKIVVVLAPPMTVGFFRFLTAILLFLPFLVLTERQSLKTLSRRDWALSFLLGLTGIFGYGVLFLTGMQFTTAAQGAIIAGVNPTTVSLLAHITHKERLNPKWRYIGYLFSFLGIVCVVGIQALLDFQLTYIIGNLILLCAMFTWGLYSVLGKTAMENQSSLEATTSGILFGTLLFGLGAITEQFWTLPAMVDIIFWVNILYMGIFVTFLGFLFYFIGIKNLGASRSAIFISLVPVSGTILSALILQETIYWTFLIGLILVVIGILFINYPHKATSPLQEQNNQ